MYRLLRSILFLTPPEWAHYFSMNCLGLICRLGLRNTVKQRFKSKPLPKTVFGLSFKNPVGLAAGFDKNAKYLSELECLGFGHVEIGTVTPLPQSGNEQPRLFRLPKDRALINRMGFNNEGVEAVAARLKKWKQDKDHQTMIIGGNIGKNKQTANETAWKDYEICFLALHDYVDYFVVNVSSPNTPGLRELQEKHSLRQILTHLQSLDKLQKVHRPLLLKIAPDLSKEQLDDVIDLATEIGLDGLVACNTTIGRENLLTAESAVSRIGAGGLSGKPLQERSTAILKYIHERSGGKFPVIASGGVFTGADAREKLEAGAALVQVWTGFIYEGPGIVKKICNSLDS